MGFEPTDNGFAIRSKKTANQFNTVVYENSNSKLGVKLGAALAEQAAFTRQLADLLTDHPDLADVLTAWPTLPDAMRRGILAMIQAAEDSA
ncbi:MAG: hypothetical protein ACYC26_09885 [Phycisphaerales bacterium]